MEDTKVIYHIDDEETPYLVKLSVAPNFVTLADFKQILSRSGEIYKFFFKSKDDDFGVVKEEICDDSAKLPLFNGRVVAWVVSLNSEEVPREDEIHSEIPSERRPGVGETRPPSFHGRRSRKQTLLSSSDSGDNSENDGVFHGHGSERESGHDDSESHITSVSQAASRRRRLEHRSRGAALTSASSEIESSVYESTTASTLSSRFTTSTNTTSVSRNPPLLHRKKKSFKIRKIPERSGSISSITDSTLSLNVITVTLNMDTVNFLGISIVGKSDKHGDSSIYVGSIMKGGAVALDGRIDPGDMVLQVNDVNFENMSNDDAVRVLRDVVQKPGPIKLVIAKCWDSSPKGYFTIPRTEPVRPIDPGAWVAHTAAVRGDYLGRAPSVTTLSSSSIISSHPDTEKYSPGVVIREPLTIHSGMFAIVSEMSKENSGLDVRDRLWLKISIANAFLGSDVVDWLFSNVDGFSERKEAKKYAAQLLKNDFIKLAVNKTSFSEQCYYNFGSALISETNNLSTLKIRDEEDAGKMTSSGVWLGHPPPFPNTVAWNSSHVESTYNGSTYPTIYNPAPPPSANYMQLPYGSENSYMSYQQQPMQTTSILSSSGSSVPSQAKLRLAGSGSGSESGSGRQSSLRKHSNIVVKTSIPSLSCRTHK